VTDIEQLMTNASKQLAEHQEWLIAEIQKIPADYGFTMAKEFLVVQVGQIKLRMARARGGIASVVWEYPDELIAFLRNEHTPKHLRDTVADGHNVSTEQPAFTAKKILE
jgi:protein involved in ribonucleotide reduction